MSPINEFEKSPAGSLGGVVHSIPIEGLDEEAKKLEDGIALCLSGGGYRATLFHAGSLWRLAELGILGSIKRISSVSGGSITAAILGVAWQHIIQTGNSSSVNMQAFQKWVIDPVRAITATDIDVGSILWGSLKPWTLVSDEVIKKYEKTFKGKTLQDFPDHPRIVINATNIMTGSLWRFAKPYMADYRVGMVKDPQVPLAVAVAASSAFPPVLSPLRMDLSSFEFEPNIPVEAPAKELRGIAVLTDGGVYDNLGLEPVWKRYKTVLISDAGRKMDDDLKPGLDWASHSYRLIELLQHQISNLRRRTAVGAFQLKNDGHAGVYWGIQTDASKYKTSSILSCPHDQTLLIAGIPTRLAKMASRDQDRIINWGYAAADAAVRSLEPWTKLQAPTNFPYAKTKL